MAIDKSLVIQFRSILGVTTSGAAAAVEADAPTEVENMATAVKVTYEEGVDISLGY